MPRDALIERPFDQRQSVKKSKIARNVIPWTLATSLGLLFLLNAPAARAMSAEDAGLTGVVTSGAYQNFYYNCYDCVVMSDGSQAYTS
jgi:hypothetical protein